MPRTCAFGLGSGLVEFESFLNLPLVSREWRNGVQLQLLLLPFFHSLLTKDRLRVSSEVLGLPIVGASL